MDRPTQTTACGFTVGASKPSKFCSDEYVFERFTFSDTTESVMYRLAGPAVSILKESLQLLCSPA